jgi:hypothetical protein
MNQTLTNGEKVLLAAVDLCSGQLDHNFTAEELSVAAWKMDKPSFGLRGFGNDYLIQTNFSKA